MDIGTLRQMQSLPLEAKLSKTKLRIREFVETFGEDGVYISFSGGKDSTVLLDIVRSLYPDVEAVFIDTGLEYPEVKEHVRSFKNVTILRPEMNFKKVIETYGYPVISKEVTETVSQAKKSLKTGKYTYRLKKLNNELIDKKTGKKSRYNCPKWKFLLDAPFDVSNQCCNVMKKNPAKKYEKATGKKPIIGTMASESELRESKYLKHGCNIFDSKRPSSQPLSFWTEQDILEYLLKRNLSIPSVYGEIVIGENLELKTTGCNRTGCVFCGFGAHLEKGQNRYQRLENTHPQLHKYCMEVLGFKEVLEYIGIPWSGKGMIFEENQMNLFDKLK